MWHSACGTLMAPNTDDAWKRILACAPPDTAWHSLKNCVAHQATVWSSLLQKGLDDVIQPAAFKLAIVLRHTKPELVINLLAELLRLHPQSEDLITYVLALLTDDESGCYSCFSVDENSLMSSPPLRDLQLFGDLEMVILAATDEQYKNYAKLFRADYRTMSANNYATLRVRVLNQFINCQKIFHTPEFGEFEKLARDNMENEIKDLREEVMSALGRK